MQNSQQGWSKGFDIMWNNIMSNMAPGISEYEKGVFLSAAQVEVAKDYLSANANNLREGVDDSARRQADFANLIDTVSGTAVPTDALMILNESCGNNAVVPLSYREYMRVMQKPYKKPPKGQVWRIIGASGALELIPSASTSDYSATYIKCPPDINLAGTFVGSSLPEHLWDEVLIRAVNLAKIAWTDVASNK